MTCSNMFSFSRRQFFPIGIDVSHDVVRLVQLCRQSQGGLSVSAATRRPLDLPANPTPASRLRATADAIAAVLSMNEFNGRRAAVSLPSELVHLRTARLPAVPVAGGAIPAGLQAVFDIPLASTTLRLINAGSVRHSPPDGEEVIAVAIADEQLNEFTQTIHDRGVRPVSMELRMLSLHRAATRCSPETPATALLETDGDWSRLLIARGSSISFLKEIPVGVGQMINTLAKTLSINLEEARELRRRTLRGNQTDDQNDPVRRAVADAGRAELQSLASEVARCLRYHAVTFRGRQPVSLIVCGAQADDNQLNTLLTSRTGLAVTPIDPFQNIDTSVMRAADRTENRSEWGVALGLALRQVDSMKLTNHGNDSAQQREQDAVTGMPGKPQGAEVAVA
jgi:type IV pilus assembly protein PilM